MKNVSVLGSTGSVGCNTLDVIRAFPDKLQVIGLAAGKNLPLLAEQIAEFKPLIVSVSDRADLDKLSKQLVANRVDTGSLVLMDGTEGATAVATHPRAQLVVSAISGSKGLLPTYKAVEAGKNIAIANKETLVMAGNLIMNKARERNVEILPVDSEHNAIHQCLRGERRSDIKRFILTASGGPFFNTAKAELSEVTLAQALKHPRWEMGRKITIDSATLMNKGLEAIEAHWLFGATADEIDVVIHPQSTVHSLVELIDGSVIAQMGVTDMRMAIQYALMYPERSECKLPSFDLKKIGPLEFFEPDLDKFPCLELGYRSLRAGGTMPIVLNAANEVAVDAFLSEHIRFTDIPEIIEAVMNGHRVKPVDSMEAVLEADRLAREKAQALVPWARAQHM